MAEIERDYMRLPLDADGMPIHVGDELECNANGYKGTFTVFAVGDNYVIGNHEIEWIKDNPSKWFHIASYCRHVKPRITNYEHYYSSPEKVAGIDCILDCYMCSFPRAIPCFMEFDSDRETILKWLNSEYDENANHERKI